MSEAVLLVWPVDPSILWIKWLRARGWPAGDSIKLSPASDVLLDDIEADEENWKLVILLVTVFSI